MFVSVLHMIFEFLAFQSDIQFWRGKDSVEGISIRSLYLELLMQIVVQLYLQDNETSFLIWAPQAVGVLLTVWKLSQAAKLQSTNSFPYFAIVEKASYADTPTKQYDR